MLTKINFLFIEVSDEENSDESDVDTEEGHGLSQEPETKKIRVWTQLS